MKIGDVRYSAWIDPDTGKIDIDVYVLRTVRRQKDRAWRHSIYVEYGYWTQKLHNITWIKRSKKHGDWGFAKNVDRIWVTKRPLKEGPPYSATRHGALHALSASIQSCYNRWGDDPEEKLSAKEQIARVDRAWAREKKKVTK